MSKDINTVIGEWAYDPEDETENVRLIDGIDGKDKIQILIPCGLIQWETSGRPDGETPHGHESLLHFLESEIAQDNPIMFDQELKDELNQEIMSFYARRVAFFRLTKFEQARSDAEHNLRIMNLVRKHSADEEFISEHEKWRPFLLMDLTRATALGNAQNEMYMEAIDSINDGIETIRGLYEAHGMEDEDEVQEVRALEDLKFYLRETHDLGLTSRELIQTLEDDKSQAIEDEDFERARQINLRLDALKQSQN